MSGTPNEPRPGPEPSSQDGPPSGPEGEAKKRPWTFLGRLAEAVREQNWFAVTLEVLIVVLGVVIGFQINTWGAAQADARLSRAYAERLLIDLRQDRVARQNILDYYEVVTANAERTVDLLDDPAADPLALVVHAYRATEYTYSPKTRATWDEIVSSGRVGLLPRVVGESMSDVYGYDYAFASRNALKGSPYRLRVRSVLPHAVQSAIREGCSDLRDEVGLVSGFQNDCGLHLNESVLAAAARALQEDPTVAEGLRYQFSDLASALASVRAEVAYIDRAIAALEGQDPDEKRE